MPPPPATSDADPSMEEILASIRRILNEEPAADAAGTTEPDDGVLVLDKSMMRGPSEPHDAPEAETGHPTEPTGEVHPAAETATDPAPEPAADLGAEPATDPSAETTTNESQPAGAPAADLVAPEAAAAAAHAMGNLMRTLAADRRPKVWSDGPTLEDLVRVTLRPLLKEWLDANLPPIVERLVRAEIERVVGRVIP